MDVSFALTHGHQAPHDGRSGEAGEDVVGAGEVGAVGEDYGLAAALTPHVDLEESPPLSQQHTRTERL